jgi:hypothetical protein
MGMGMMMPMLVVVVIMVVIVPGMVVMDMVVTGLAPFFLVKLLP